MYYKNPRIMVLGVRIVTLDIHEADTTGVFLYVRVSDIKGLKYMSFKICKYVTSILLALSLTLACSLNVDSENIYPKLYSDLFTYCADELTNYTLGDIKGYIEEHGYTYEEIPQFSKIRVTGESGDTVEIYCYKGLEDNYTPVGAAYYENGYYSDGITVAYYPDSFVGDMRGIIYTLSERSNIDIDNLEVKQSATREDFEYYLFSK